MRILLVDDEPALRELLRATLESAEITVDEADSVAGAEALDTSAKLGFAPPMGPLALADLIGSDTGVASMEVLHHGLGDPKYAPCPLLRQYVQAGRLGRKTGRGFYTY